MPGPGSIAVDSVTHSWLLWGQPGEGDGLQGWERETQWLPAPSGFVGPCFFCCLVFTASDFGRGISQ